MNRSTKKKVIYFLFPITVILLSVVFFLRKSDAPDKLNFLLEKQSEFKINSLNPVEIVDYHLQSDLFLGYTHVSKGLEITLIDENGKILLSKNMQGEAPGQYLSNLNGLSFSSTGDIWAITNAEILLYDQQLKLKEKQIFSAHSAISLYDRVDRLSYFYPRENDKIPSFIINPNEVPLYFKMDYEFYDSKMIEINSWRKDTTFRIASISDRGISDNIDLSISTMFGPVYTLDNEKQKLYLTGTLDNEITVYDLNSEKVIKRIKITHEDFIKLGPGKITKTDLPIYNTKILIISKNHKLHKLENGTLILDYITTISEGLIEQKMIDNPRYLQSKDPSNHRLILFNQDGQISSDLLLPPNGKLSAIMPGNRLLFLIEPEKEEDFIRYEIFKFQKE